MGATRRRWKGKGEGGKEKRRGGKGRKGGKDRRKERRKEKRKVEEERKKKEEEEGVLHSEQTRTAKNPEPPTRGRFPPTLVILRLGAV